MILANKYVKLYLIFLQVMIYMCTHFLLSIKEIEKILSDVKLLEF